LLNQICKGSASCLFEEKGVLKLKKNHVFLYGYRLHSPKSVPCSEGDGVRGGKRMHISDKRMQIDEKAPCRTIGFWSVARVDFPDGIHGSEVIKTSTCLFVSPATRLLAAESKATNRPSQLIFDPQLISFPSRPAGGDDIIAAGAVGGGVGSDGINRSAERPLLDRPGNRGVGGSCNGGLKTERLAGFDGDRLRDDPDCDSRRGRGRPLRRSRRRRVKRRGSEGE